MLAVNRQTVLPLTRFSRKARSRGLRDRHGVRPSAALALLTLTLLAGCSSGSTTAVKSPTATPIATATPTTTSTPSATNYAADPKGLGSPMQVSGPSGTTTTEQRAVLSVWNRYWQLRGVSYNSQGGALDLDFANLDAVATGNARNNVITGSSERFKKGIYTVGPVQFTITSVEIQGSSAIVHGCMHDQSYEVNSKGETVAAAPGDSPIADQLTQTPTGWRVSDTPTVAGSCAA